MRFLAVVGVVLALLALGGAGYAYLGFYNVAASDPHEPYVGRSLDLAMEKSVERRVESEVPPAPSLDDPKMVRTGGQHFRQEGCVACHGGPGAEPVGFARHMRPTPPNLTRTAARWSDAELFWIMKHGVKMTGMPAFGPTHSPEALWAMVSFVRRLPTMSSDEFTELTASPDGHGGDDGDRRDGDHRGTRHKGSIMLADGPTAR